MVFAGLTALLELSLLIYICEARGSCREANLCCSGRDSSCVVYSAGNSVVPNEHQSLQLCYCDHACVKVGDCCQDYEYICGASHCEVSDWGPWSECNTPCGTGIMTRERNIIRPPKNGGDPCPDLLQKRSCYGNRCDKSALHVKSYRETAMILPATYSNVRHINETNDIRKNLKLKYKKDPAEEKSKEYCVVFEVTKATKACKSIGEEFELKLVKGHKTCVRCETAAMRKHLGYRCQGHGAEHKPTRFTFLAAPICHGRWQRMQVVDNCNCHPDGQADFIFV